MDPHPDPLGTSRDPAPAPDPSIVFEELCKCTSVPDPDLKDPYVNGPPGSAFEPVSQR